MQDFSNYDFFKPQFEQPVEPEKPINLISKLKEKLQETNKNVLIGVLIVIAAGVIVGGIITTRHNNNIGQVQGVMAESSPTDTPLPTNTTTATPTSTPNDTPTDIPTSTTLDTSAEGSAPTDTPTDTPQPTNTPAPTATPTPTAPPNTYSANITNVSNSSANSDGNAAINITVNVTKNGSSDCGETVTLVSNPTGVNFSSSSCNSGSIIFTATSTTAGTYHVTPQVYNVSYGNGTDIVFNAPTP